MSSPINASSSASAAATAAANLAAAEKPRLTEQEKKNNHIASEQKRRQAIRDGFDKLASIVPGMEGQGRSEAVVLQATIDYVKEQLDERRRLLEKAQALGYDSSAYELDQQYDDSSNQQHHHHGKGSNNGIA